MKTFLKKITPPLIVELVKSIKDRGNFEYAGDFKTWSEAVAASTGYGDPAIFEKIKNARLSVLRGEKSYERDSVLFDAPQYFWPLLSALLWIASKENNTLKLLDFGGSLGSSYFQNLKFLKHLSLFSWNIVEQKHFVEFGQKNLASRTLKFYDTVKTCLEIERPHALLASSVLQYMEQPYGFLADIKREKIKYIIFDRTTFLENGLDRITVQNVPKKIYDASFPAWLFNLENFKKYFADEYNLVAEWPSIGDPITLKNSVARNKGLLFERKN